MKKISVRDVVNRSVSIFSTRSFFFFTCRFHSNDIFVFFLIFQAFTFIFFHFNLNSSKANFLCPSPLPDRPVPDGPPSDRTKFHFFFPPSPTTIFFLSFLVQGFTRQSENSKRAHLRAPSASNTTQIPRKDPQKKEERMKIVAGEGKKKARNFGSPTLRGPTLRAPPFGAPPFRAPPFRAPPFGAAPFGAAPFGAPPFGAPPFGTSTNFGRSALLLIEPKCYQKHWSK